MSDNNRYSGEVYIDQDTDNLFAAFMQNILNVYSGSGKNFDADKLDGRHWDHEPEEGGVEGIKQYIDNKCDTILNLDNTHFLTKISINNKDGELDEDGEYTSTVKFNITSSDINISDDLQQDINIVDESQQPDISNVDQALSFLYTNYMKINDNINIEKFTDQTSEETQDQPDNIAEFASFLSSKVDQLNNDVSQLSILNSYLKTDDQNNTYFTADRISDYNIIPVTKATYDRLNGITNPDDNEYKYFHHPKNIFIISANVEDDNTVDNKYHYNLTTGYDFQVNDQGWLQCKHKWSSDDAWDNVADLTDILGLTGQSAHSSSFGQAILYLVRQYIQEQVNQVELNQFIKDQIQEQVYTQYINNIRYKRQPLQKHQDTDNYYYIDLDSIINEVITTTHNDLTTITDNMVRDISDQASRAINPTVSQIRSDVSSHTLDIERLQSQVQQLSESMNKINTSIQEKVTQTCGNQISNLVSDKVSELSKSVMQINSYGSYNQNTHWKSVPISWGINNQQSSLDYNEGLQLAILHLHTQHRHMKGNKGATVNRYGANGYDPKKLPNDITPVNRIWARLMPSRYVVLETDGSIKFNFEFEPTSETYGVHIDIPFFYNFVDEWL